MGGFLTYICFSAILCLDFSHEVYMIIISSCGGLFLLPPVSILISYASEAIYPLGQASSSGYQFAASQTFGFIFGILVIVFIKGGAEEQRKYRVYWVLGVECLFFLISFFFALSTK